MTKGTISVIARAKEVKMLSKATQIIGTVLLVAKVRLRKTFSDKLKISALTAGKRYIKASAILKSKVIHQERKTASCSLPLYAHALPYRRSKQH